MRYFTEIADYQTYQGEEADFHFNFNANSGGGQSRLGGKFYDANGDLSTPIQLNGRVAVFAFVISGNIIQLSDPSVEYEVKPRDEGNTNMKLGVGNNHNPSEAIATFLMLPKPCGVKKANDVNTSVLNSNNYWLQSMWLGVDTSTEGKAIFTPKDCIICGGIDKQGQGVARYFSVDFAKRFADIISAANNNELDGEVLTCVKLFADIYKGEKPFVYDESAEAIKAVMKYLSSKYPEEYSGTLDPLTMISKLAHIKEIVPLQVQVDVRSDILAAIRTKPFILLAGISGTGKSRMVRQLARGCCPRHKEGSTTEDHPLYDEQKPGNFEMIPVRPNWHDSTELMGYVTRISSDNKPKYVLTPFVHFLVKAWLHPDVPFFLCLDEMNLAPVEQYFAEYLSAIESRKKDSSGKINTDVLVRFDVAQIDDDTNKFVKATVDALLKDYKPAAGSPVDAIVTDLERKMIEDKGLRIPPNLVVMGTVNMDETTCTFSRKVLDRAMSFELNDVSDMYAPDKLVGEGDYEFGSIDTDAAKGTLLTGKEAYDSAGGHGVAVAADNTKVGDAVLAFLENLNEKEMPAKKADGSDGEGTMSLLAKTPFKIAYRSRNEIMIYCIERIAGNIVPLPQALDEALSMKVLSRIEGDSQHVRPEWLQTLSAAIVDGLSKLDGYDADKCVVCKDKLADMVEQAQYGYTSFWMR